MMDADAIFKVGGSLEKDAPSYVMRAADTLLYESLKRGEFCYVLNCRQMGKSSLLVRTSYRLKDEGFRCATLDMTLIGNEDITPLQWYKGIVTVLCQKFGAGHFNLKKWWKEREDVSLLQRLGEFVEELLRLFPDDRLFIFVDEIDNILSLNFPVDDFFALIRYCYNQRAIAPEFNRITFAIFGVASPSDLIRDRQKTPFNIGTAIPLSGLSLEEAKPLEKGLQIPGFDPRILLREVLSWTGGQPFLTQKLCKLIVLTVRDSQKISVQTEAELVEKIAIAKIVDNWHFQDEPEHLKTISNRLLRSPNQSAGALSVYQKILQKYSVKFDGSAIHVELLLSGIVENLSENLKAKNLIYESVFDLIWARKNLEKIRPYYREIDAWISSQKTDESRLLRGRVLREAQGWAQDKSLGDLDYQFLARSAEFDRQEVQNALEAERSQAIQAQLLQEQKNNRLQKILLAIASFSALIFAGIGGVALWQYQRAKVSEILATAFFSEALFASGQQLDSIVAAIRAKRQLQNLIVGADKETISQVQNTLKQAVYGTNELNRIVGHNGSVLTVDISPDDQLIATGSNDKTVKIWRRNGQLLHTLKHGGTVHRIAFSPEGDRIVAASLDGNIHLWSVGGELLARWRGHDAPVWGIDISPDGKLIASASGDKTVKLWSISGDKNSTPALLRTLTGHDIAPWNVAFSPDSKWVASAGVDTTVKLWKVDGTAVKTLEGHRMPVWDVAFCPPMNWLVSVSSDRTFKLWDMEGKLLNSVETEDAIIGVDCSKNGTFIATGGQDNGIKIWKPDGTLVRPLKQHDAVVRDVALQSDGLMAASVSDDGTVKLWGRNSNLANPLYGHEDTVWDVATSPDGRWVVSAGDKTLQLWDTAGRRLHTLANPEGQVRAVAFTPDSRGMIFGSNVGTLEIWEWGEGPLSEMRRTQVLNGHAASVYAVAVSPDGQTIASAGDDKTIKLWTRNGELRHSFFAHEERIWKLEFTPDGKQLVSASEDGTAKLWDIEGTARATFSHDGVVWGVAVHPHKNLVASVSRDDTLKLWKFDGTLVRSLPGNSRGLTRVAFSPDGETIATAGVDNTVKLWDLQGNLLSTLPGHRGMVISLAFTADGGFLVSGGDDTTVILWNLQQMETSNELEYACNWVRDYLQTSPEVGSDYYHQNQLGDRSLCDGVGDRHRKGTNPFIRHDN
ncbi:AAA-like domain-containing protein [Lyngbya sp. CCY1209]|uniref:WD40 domain-containing protein n=1 Tax=Lyngbya sp. CCY1209 TaxID=2886103 RepID=UPI002D2168AB|nr:AAA-like domain-containing protein [Lyngbya sp. CCY1209]MEB3884256.1 AAA-like domain-containing protein [Lyngbya sp. CCY1209]